MAGAQNDRQLLATALRLSDAYDQPRLVFRIEDGVEPIAVINIYRHSRFPDQKVHCIHCNGQRHGKGFTALLTDGNRALFGSTCGSEFFGRSWEDREAEFRNQLDRQYELRRIERAKMIAAPLRGGLRSWRLPLERLDAVLRSFERTLPEMWAGLSAAHHARFDRLTLPERIRDHATEALKDGAGARWIVVEKAYAAMAGGGIFEVQSIVSGREQAVEALTDYEAVFNATDGRPTSDLKAKRQRLERSLGALERAFALRSNAAAFFVGRNLAVVAEWHRRRTGEVVAAANGRLSSVAGASVGLHTVPDLPVEPIELAREFRRDD